MNKMDVALICKALSDSNRLEIIQMLSEGEKCGCKLLERFEITQPTLSHHMKTLVESDLVNDRKDGKWHYYSLNTDNQIHYGPVLENIVYFYARSMNNAVSVGRIGKLECDFLIRNPDMDYSYVQVAYTILSSKETEDREYRSLELIRDNYPKYVMTTDYLLQHRNGIIHVNLLDFIKGETQF